MNKIYRYERTVDGTRYFASYSYIEMGRAKWRLIESATLREVCWRLLPIDIDGKEAFEALLPCKMKPDPLYGFLWTAA
tara:strand:- start:1225 stop:1458 length:234 start_codon:yes stop_codon:yes gene_type:complete